jgi:hypothetical protein
MFGVLLLFHMEWTPFWALTVLPKVLSARQDTPVTNLLSRVLLFTTSITITTEGVNYNVSNVAAFHASSCNYSSSSRYEKEIKTR